MTNHRCGIRASILLGSLIVSLISPARGASLLESLGLKKSGDSAGLASLSQDQIVSGLKEALSKGVQHAVTNLGHTDGFLGDARVKIPLPENLRKIESGLRAVGQGKLADDFVTTMNRAAEQAVPVAAGVLGDSVSKMSIADAKGILTSTNAAATEYFKRTTTTNLFAKFLPIVKKATEATGVTANYKKMVDRSDLGGLGGFGGFSVNKESFDVDSYVTKKAMDGLFLKVAEQEKAIRENPAARSTALLQQVFGSVQPSK